MPRTMLSSYRQAFLLAAATSEATLLKRALFALIITWFEDIIKHDDKIWEKMYIKSDFYNIIFHILIFFHIVFNAFISQ